MQEGEKESNSTQYNSTHFNISYGKTQHNKISYSKMKKDITQKRGKKFELHTVKRLFEYHT